MTALERDGARLEGERGQLTASIASAKGKIAETQLQILQVDAEMRAEVARTWPRSGRSGRSCPRSGWPGRTS